MHQIRVGGNRCAFLFRVGRRQPVYTNREIVLAEFALVRDAEPGVEYSVLRFVTDGPMCPQCRQPMLIVEHHGVEIDHCPQCGGVWLDAGELELLAELAGAETTALAEVLADAQTIKRDRRPCPRCARRMQVVAVAQPPIEIDRCRYGEGLWLDRGELAALIRACSADYDAAAAFLGDLFADELKRAQNAEGD